MFQAVGDLVTLRWLREHPLVTTSVAAATAAYSYAFPEDPSFPSKPEDASSSSTDSLSPTSSTSSASSTTSSTAPASSLPAKGNSSKSTSSSNHSKAISWGDERGGKLIQFAQEEPQFEVDEPPTPPSRSVPKNRSMILNPHLVSSSDGRQVTVMASRNNRETSSNSDSLAARSETYVMQDSEGDEEEGALSGKKPVSPESPQWGWFVSMTPPQNSMYAPAQLEELNDDEDK